MKTNLFSSKKRIVLALAMAASAAISGQIQAQTTTLGVGDISFISAEADTNGAVADAYSIVTWTNLTAGTVLKFTDNGIANAAATSINTSEHAWTFTVGATAIAAGTTLAFGYDSPTSSKWNGPSSGTVSADLSTDTGGAGNSGISTNGDQLFVYQGTGTVPNISSAGAFSGTLASGINFGVLATSGSVDSNSTYAPTSLVNGNAWVDVGNFDNAYYGGVRTGLTNALYRAATTNVTNFSASNTNTPAYDKTTSFTIQTSASIYWDANGATANDGGTGIWDSTTQSRFKNGAAGTTFTRWVNSTTNNAHTAVFGGTAGTVSVAASGVTASGLQFDTTGYTVTANTVTLRDTATIDAGTGITATINSALAGAVGFTKTGAGTVVLGGAQSGITAGDINVNGGTLRAGATDVDFIPAVGTLTVASGATVDLNGHAETIGALAGSGVITTGATTTNVRFGFGNTLGSTFGGTIQNGNGSIYIEKNGTGTVTLSGSNTFSGTTVVGDRALASAIIHNEGGLAFTSNAALGAAGGDLYLDGGSFATDSLIFDADGITLDAGRILNVNTLTSLEVGTGRTGTIAGSLQGDDNDGAAVGGNDSVNKTGAGTLILSGSTDQLDEVTVTAGTLRTDVALNTARVNVNGGTLLLGADNRIVNTSVIVLGGGTFDTGGFDETVGALTLSANSTIALGAGDSILNFTGTSTRTGGLLTITGWSGTVAGGGTDQVIFANSLSPTFLSNIQFTSFGVGATQLGTGEIVPVPEPSTYVGGGLILGLAAWSQRKRFGFAA